MSKNKKIQNYIQLLIKERSKLSYLLYLQTTHGHHTVQVQLPQKHKYLSFYLKKKQKFSKLDPASVIRNIKNYLIYSILSTDNTRTSHSSGSVAPEAHIPITTFVVALIHTDVRAPQGHPQHSAHLTLPLILA